MTAVPYRTRGRNGRWLAFGLGVALTGLALIFYLSREYHKATLLQEERLLQRAEIISRNTVLNLEALNNLLLSLQKDPLLRAGAKVYNQRFEDLTKAMPGVRTLLALDAEGSVLVSSNSELLGKNFSDRDYFKIPQQQAAADLLYVSPPFRTTLNTYVINLSRLLRGPDGRFAGVVAASLDPDYFSALLASVSYAPDMLSALAHGDGLLFLMEPGRAAAIGKNLAVPGSFFSRHRDSGKVSSVQRGVVYATGKKQMMAQITIQPQSLKMNKPLVVAVSRDLAAIYAGWREEAGLLTLLFLAAVLLSGGCLQMYNKRQEEFRQRQEAYDCHVRELSEELDRFFSTSLDLLCIADLEGHFRRLNRSWEERLGYRIDELIGRNFLDFVHPDDIAATLAAMTDLAADKQVLNFINRYRCRDGSYRWIEWRSTPYADLIYAAARDITERKEVEVLLRSTLTELERFREALDHVTSYIYMKDRDHRYVYANKATLELFGVSRDELVGSRDSRFFPPETVTKLYLVDERVLQGEQTSAEIEVDNGATGSRCYWEIKTPIYEDPGRRVVWGICGISTDITELKQVQRQLELRTLEAEAANRAKSDFLANMSHEIRTPMNAIIGLTHLVLETELTAYQRDFLNKVYSSSRALMGILNDILDYSKIEAGRIELEYLPISLEAVVQGTMDLFRVKAEDKGLVLTAELPTPLPAVLSGDPLRLAQVLNNLVGNAVKFTEHGEILIRVEQVEEDTRTVSLCFTVQDSGIGLEQEEMERLFHPFTQADGTISRKYGGTGLGLTISQRLVMLMGGKITVSSQKGAGSSFSFVVPMGKVAPGTRPTNLSARGAEPIPPTEAVLEQRASELAGVRILLVEDNRINRDVATEMLRIYGAHVMSAEHGTEALELLKQNSFDVVLMDLHMPVMDGFETTRRIRQQYAGQTLPVIAMTAAVMQQDRERCKEAGMVDFLAKPINPTELLAVLQKWRNVVTPSLQDKDQPVPATVHDDVFPHLSGFDMEVCRSRMNGDLRLFRGLLEAFVADHGRDAAMLRNLFSAEKITEAGHLVHTLKGVAGTLGAVDLAKAAFELEQQLRSPAGQVDPERFARQVEVTVSTISDYLSGTGGRLV